MKKTLVCIVAMIALYGAIAAHSGATAGDAFKASVSHRDAQIEQALK